MASILLQSRGAGLGATFGGDSTVYRSRRGIEKRLFQFTVVLRSRSASSWSFMLISSSDPKVRSAPIGAPVGSVGRAKLGPRLKRPKKRRRLRAEVAE